MTSTFNDLEMTSHDHCWAAPEMSKWPYHICTHSAISEVAQVWKCA